MMILEYVVFIGLCIMAAVLYVLHERRPKENPFVVDPESIKLESPIERKLYQALKFRGEYIET
jgi:hypothetical protein